MQWIDQKNVTCDGHESLVEANLPFLYIDLLLIVVFIFLFLEKSSLVLTYGKRGFAHILKWKSNFNIKIFILYYQISPFFKNV